MQGTAGVFSTVNTKEKDRILTDQGRATENDKLEQMQSTVAVVRGGGGKTHEELQLLTKFLVGFPRLSGDWTNRSR